MATAKDELALSRVIMSDHDKANSDGCVKKDETNYKEIGIYMEVFRVSDINTQKQTFSGELEVQLTWLPSKDDFVNYKNDTENYKPSYIPTFSWDNAEEVSMNLEGKYELMENGGIDFWGCEVELCVPFVNAAVYMVTGKFVVPNMHLANFPFDVTNLPIIVEARQIIDTAILVPSFDVGNDTVTMSANCQKLNPEFRVHAPIVEMSTNIHDGEHYSTFIVHLKLERYWTVYSATFGTLFALCLCTLSIFLLDHVENLSDRISNLFTMLLTIIAYQFVLGSQLPNLPYNTKLDLYLLSCFAFLVVSILHAVVSNIVDSEDYDRYGSYALAAGVCLFNVCFVAFAVRTKKYELRKLEWIQRDYDSLHVDKDNIEVPHSSCYFSKVIEERLGNYWAEYVNIKNGT